MADRPRRERLLTFLLLPAIIVGVFVLAGYPVKIAGPLEFCGGIPVQGFVKEA